MEPELPRNARYFPSGEYAGAQTSSNVCVGPLGTSVRLFVPSSLTTSIRKSGSPTVNAISRWLPTGTGFQATQEKSPDPEATTRTSIQFAFRVSSLDCPLLSVTQYASREPSLDQTGGFNNPLPGAGTQITANDVG